MDYFRPDIRVGVFIFVALVLFVVAALVMGGVRTWFTPSQEYIVLLPNANMIRRHAKVTYAGSPVGEVTTIAVHNSNLWRQQHPTYPVAVTIVVRGPVTLHEDARVEMRTDGFIGDRYLDISPGYGLPLALDKPLLGSIGGVEGMLMSLSGLGSGLGEMSDSLRTILGNGSQAQSLPATLGSLQQLLDDLRPRLVELTGALTDLTSGVRKDVAALSSQTGQTLAGLDTAVAENSTALKRLVRELHSSLGEINKTMTATQATLGSAKTLLTTTQGDSTRLFASLRELSGSLQRQMEVTLADLQHVLTRADTMLAQNDRNLYSSIESLRNMAESLKDAARQVQANPSVLVWGSGTKSEPESIRTPEAARRALQDRGRVGRYDTLQ